MIKMRCRTWMNTRSVTNAARKAAIPRLRECTLLVEREAKRSMKAGGKMRRVKGSGRKRTRWSRRFRCCSKD